MKTKYKKTPEYKKTYKCKYKKTQHIKYKNIKYKNIKKHLKSF